MKVAQLITQLQSLDPDTVVVHADEHGDFQEGVYFQHLKFFRKTEERTLPDGTTHTWQEIVLVHPGYEEEYDEPLTACVNIHH